MNTHAKLRATRRVILPRRTMVAVALAIGLPTPTSAFAFGEAAEELVRQLGIETYYASRKDQDFYDLLEGYVIKTRYCYVYAYSEQVVIAGGKLIFIESDEVCEIDGIYQK